MGTQVCALVCKMQKQVLHSAWPMDVKVHGVPMRCVQEDKQEGLLRMTTL
jgi:hypothetical protein